VYSNNEPRVTSGINLIKINTQAFEKGMYFVKVGNTIKKVVR